MTSPIQRLYRPQELAFRTQYSELKERAGSLLELLPGTPGTLFKRTGTGYAYWYRVYYSAGGTQVEQLMGKDGEAEKLLNAAQEIEFAKWMQEQVRSLRKLDFQVADKGVAAVLVELLNKGILRAGLTLVGTLAYMVWLNELGARAVSARTQDIDLATRQTLKLAAAQSFLETVQATRLGFTPVPGMPSQEPPTSIKRPGSDGLRVDILAHGKTLGKTVPIPQLEWHAQTVPHYDYLLRAPQQAALLAGGHCVPLAVPAAARLVWHKLYASESRTSFPEKAEKDLLQAATLAAVLTEQQDELLADSFADVPVAMRGNIRQRLPALRRVLTGHPRALEQFEDVLAL